MDRKKGTVHFTSVELIQVVLKNIKKEKRQNERGRSCSQVTKHSSYYFTVAVKSSGDISAEAVRAQKIEKHVVTDLDLRNDVIGHSLTNGAAAEDRQEVSSKNTIQ